MNDRYGTTVVLTFLLLAQAGPPAMGQRGRSQPVELPDGARVAVIAMNSHGGAQVDTVVGDMLTTAFRGAGMRVLERMELDAVLREQRLARGGDVDPETAVAPGKIIGAEYLVGAKATEFGIRDTRHGGLFGLGPFGGVQIRTTTARVALDARILDVRTGEVLATAEGEGKIVNYGGSLIGGSWVGGSITLGGVDVNSKEWSESLLGRAARKAVDVVVKKLIGNTPSSSGRVMAVTDEGWVIVSLGSRDGMRAGERVDVYDLTQIKDRAGEPVWTEERRVGQLRLTEVRLDRSKAEVVEGDRPSERMLVRRRGRSAPERGSIE
jgi:curli biogenesis system outer membrane secretion channel CsgG